MRRAVPGLRLFLAAAFGLAAVLAAELVGLARPARADVFIPHFMDPKLRIERPDTSPLRVIRFLTDDEFPPLHFADPEGGLAGFSVDLARAICEKMNLACTIQARRFDTLLDSLGEGRGDVLAAAIPLTGTLRQRFAASHVYHRTPARFVTAQGQSAQTPAPALMDGRKVAVVEGSAHAAFLGAFFPRAERRHGLVAAPAQGR